MRRAVQRDRILVVDDEPLTRSFCRQLLAAEYDVFEAADGPSALELLVQQQVDLVLLDVVMPGMDGFEVCSKIKACASGFLPVLFLTSLGDQRERNAGLHVGADDFLTKPFDRRELLLRVSAFVRLRRQDALIREQMEHLQELQALKDDLVSLIVHDLRNPLAGMTAFLEVLRQQLPRDASREQVEDFNQILLCAARMRSSLQDVLQIRSIEDGALRARRQPVRLMDTVREAVGTASLEARSRGIDVRCSSEGDRVIEIDPELVVRSIENLVHNAVKYSKGGDAVEVSVHGGAGNARLEVADRGPGIPDEMKERVFDKFAAVESRRLQAGRGFGLGLYLVNLTMAAHGGTACVRDREGGGSIFTLSFPAGVA